MSDIKLLKENSRIAVRLPNWLGDVCMALPIIRAIQQHIEKDHSSATLTLLVQPQYMSLLQHLGIDTDFLVLPKKSWNYYGWCISQRKQFDIHIMLTNSARGDLEAWLMQSSVRWGMQRPHKKRRLLTDRYLLVGDYLSLKTHQTKLWEDFTQTIGLHNGVDYTPLSPPNHHYKQKIKTSRIGLICGSANNPSKRWPIHYWLTLIESLIAEGCEHVVLLGSSDDQSICNDIAKNINSDKLNNLAGKTNFTGLIDTMRTLDWVIGNDTGGLHLANALGVSVLGLYGVTSPEFSSPIINAPLAILESPNTMNKSMSDITVEDVMRVLKRV